MRGNRYLLDTNAIIQLLKGNHDLIALLNAAAFVSTSTIAELEFLSFPRMDEDGKRVFQSFRSRICVYDLSSDNEELKRYILEARGMGLKLPDAIIAGTAKVNNLTLLTADDHFSKLGEDWNVKMYSVDSEI